MTDEFPVRPWPMLRGWRRHVSLLAPVAMLAMSLTGSLTADLLVEAAVIVLVVAVCTTALVQVIRFPARERRRVAARIAAGMTPWDAAGPWDPRSIPVERPQWGMVWLLMVPYLAVGAGLKFHMPLVTYLGLAAAIPLTVLWVRGRMRGRVVVHSLVMPAALGSTVRFTVSTDAGGSSVTDLHCALRCVRTVGKIPRLASALEAYGDAPDSAGPEEEVVLTFVLPAGLPGTDLSGETTIHWEMLVTGRTPWGEIAGVVQVPVYAVAA